MAQRFEYNSLYPEPPHGVFHSPVLSPNGHSLHQSINQHMSPFYQQQRMSHDLYAHAATTTAATTPVPSAASAFDTFDDLYTDPSLTAMLGGDHMSPTMLHEDPDMRTSSLSTGSGPSAPSSAVGSPRSHHSIPPTAAPEWPAGPNIVQQGDFFVSGDYSLAGGYQNDDFAHFEFPQPKSFVADPSVLHSEVRSMGIPAFDSFTPTPALHLHQNHPHHHQHQHQHQHQQPHPHHHQHHHQSQHQSHAPAATSYATSPAHSPLLKTDAHSPYPASAGPYVTQFSPFLASTPMGGTGSGSSGSVVSVGPDQVVSRGGSRGSFSFSGFSASADQPVSDGEGKEKQKCPYPECGRRYKDIRAHMLTHMNERPEKCPIQTCEYHTKGFARKYDKNRHTLTHYKGTMVCGFCPGSGSSAEKSFNRADVFKRHLTAVHGVEQTPPNSRKKGSGSGSGTPGSVQELTTYAPDATGKCSTCTQTFSNAQEFYEHLDDCVLRIVQLEDPAEAVNASRLAEVENDFDVMATLEKNQLPATEGTPMSSSAAPAGDDEDDEMEFDEYAVGDDESPRDANSALSGLSGHSGSPSKRHSRLNPANGVQKSRGMTHSRGGVPFAGKTRSRRSRQNYPTSWGFDKGQMTMRKRVMTVFAGPRRLAKDDMMLSTEHEVRLKLSDGKAYVTDLDVQTMKRAEGFLAATDEEKGVWVSDDPTAEQIKQMRNGNI